MRALCEQTYASGERREREEQRQRRREEMTQCKRGAEEKSERVRTTSDRQRHRDVVEESKHGQTKSSWPKAFNYLLFSLPFPLPLLFVCFSVDHTAYPTPFFSPRSNHLLLHFRSVFVSAGLYVVSRIVRVMSLHHVRTFQVRFRQLLIWYVRCRLLYVSRFCGSQFIQYMFLVLQLFGMAAACPYLFCICVS